MWNPLGFRENPYSTRPLRPTFDDVALLVGREDEAIKFCTALEAEKGGVLVLSGVPGVGKTSFFNIQQYLLSEQQSPCGPKLLTTTEICSTQSDDTPREVALRALRSLAISVEHYCNSKQIKIPKSAVSIKRWLSTTPKSGNQAFSLGVSILGCGGSFGRTVSVPPVSEASFEDLRDLMEAIASEIVVDLGFEGAFVCLDNIENITDETLRKVLLASRDTLFSIPHVWWVLVGQSGLDSLIQSIEPKVHQRISDSLELSPISFDQLDEAIVKRVARFRADDSAKAPLPAQVHEYLYESSQGEIRFVFNYATRVCSDWVTSVRRKVTELHAPIAREALDAALGAYLVSHQITTEQAQDLLISICKREIEGYQLREKDQRILREIWANGQVRPKDHASFGIKTMQDFVTNYLTKMFEQNLLTKRREGKAVHYSLRGIARMAAEFGFFDDEP